MVNANPAMVIVPVRGEVTVFAPVAHVITAVPVPTPGDVTVMKLSRLTAVHPHPDALVVRATEPEERIDGTDADAGDSEKEHVTTVTSAVAESVTPYAFDTRTQ